MWLCWLRPRFASGSYTTNFINQKQSSQNKVMKKRSVLLLINLCCLGNNCPGKLNILEIAFKAYSWESNNLTISHVWCLIIWLMLTVSCSIRPNISIAWASWICSTRNCESGLQLLITLKFCTFLVLYLFLVKVTAGVLKDLYKNCDVSTGYQLKSYPEIYEGYVPMAYGDYLEKMSR